MEVFDYELLSQNLVKPLGRLPTLSWAQRTSLT
jgi:hypothetical protein